MSAKKKDKTPAEKPSIPVPDRLKGVLAARLQDDATAEALPTLLDLMVPKYEEKKQVTLPGKITITINGARWLVKLDLPTYVLQATIIPTSLIECLQQLELALANDTIAWMPGYSGKKKKIPTVDET